MAREHVPPDPTAPTRTTLDLSGLRVAVPTEKLLPACVEDDVVGAVLEVRRFLRDCGAQIVEGPIPIDFEDLGRRCRELIAAEAWGVHASYIENSGLPIGHWIRERVSQGKGTTRSSLLAMRATRERLRANWLLSTPNVDLVVTPTSPYSAPPLSQFDEGSPALGAFTRAVNYLGACAVSLPAGFTRDALPIGVQFVGKPSDEGTLIRVGRAWQAATDWHLRKPQGLM